MEEQNQEQSFPYQPITCPRCGSRELSLVSEAKKSIWLRLLEVLLAVSLAITFFSNLLDLWNWNIDTAESNSAYVTATQEYEAVEDITVGSTPPIHTTSDDKSEDVINTMIFLVVALGFCRVAIYLRELRVQVNAICKNCGHFWIIN